MRASKFEITIDTLKSLRVALTKDKMHQYHVRAIYIDGEDDLESVRVDGPTVDPEYANHLGATRGLELEGFAVYGCEPEAMWICGDELSYNVANTIATLLNWFYADRSLPPHGS